MELFLAPCFSALFGWWGRDISIQEEKYTGHASSPEALGNFLDRQSTLDVYPLKRGLFPEPWIEGRPVIFVYQALIARIFDEAARIHCSQPYTLLLK